MYDSGCYNSSSELRDECRKDGQLFTARFSNSSFMLFAHCYRLFLRVLLTMHRW